MVEPEDVEKTAENARIKITDQEKTQLTKEFESILEMFQKLEQINTENVEPAFHPIETEPKTRKDEPNKSLDKNQVFQNTENHENNQFKGPKA